MMTLDESACVVAEYGASGILVSETFFSSAGRQTSTHCRFVLINGHTGSRLEILYLEKGFLMDRCCRDIGGTPFCSSNLACGAERGLACPRGWVLRNDAWVDSDRLRRLLFGLDDVVIESFDGTRSHELLKALKTHVAKSKMPEKQIFLCRCYVLVCFFENGKTYNSVTMA